jgi:uncharacterized protein (DUF58 family)
MLQQRRSAIYLIIVISLLAGLITGRGFFYNVTYAFAGLLLMAFGWAWTSSNWLRMIRQTRARRAQVGRYLEERFTLRNTSFLPKLWLEVYDHSSLPGHRASHIVSSLSSQSSTSWTARTLCIRRGEFNLGPLQIIGGDPFGLFEIERKISATSRLVVYPATVDISEFSLPAGLLPGGDALRRRTHYVTTNASGVRDYVPGDSYNRIHWRSSARRDRLVVKEFELDPLADIWLILDMERTVQAGDYAPADSEAERMPWEAGSYFKIPPATEEYGVTVAASLANFFLLRDRNVGFVTEGQHREVIQTDRGGRQLTKILETLAVVRAEGTTPLEQILTLEGDQLGRGTTVIVITPSTRDGWSAAISRLLRRGLRVITVLIDAESFGGRSGSRQITRRMGVMNVPSYLIKLGDNLSVVLSSRQR